MTIQFNKQSILAKLVALNIVLLTDYVVAVDCVNTFKTRLDKYWKDQDVMYDWTSEITGTGDRSEYILEST